jgi:hypothetical protein
MKRFVFIITVLSLCFLTACKEDEYGYPPVYGEVECITPNPCVGDTLTLRVKVLSNGYGSYKGVYTWKGSTGGYILNVKSDKDNPLEPTVSPSDYIYEKNSTLYIIDPFASVPQCKYVPTVSGRHTVSMSATFNMSIATSAGTIYTGASSRSGTFTVSEKQ